MVTLRGDALFRSVPLRLLQSLGVRRGSLEVLRDSEVFVALILQGLDFRGQTAHVVSGARAFAAALLACFPLDDARADDTRAAFPELFA